MSGPGFAPRQGAGRGDGAPRWALALYAGGGLRLDRRHCVAPSMSLEFPMSYLRFVHRFPKARKLGTFFMQMSGSKVGWPAPGGSVHLALAAAKPWLPASTAARHRSAARASR